jgi:hypothetical protein
MRLHHRLIDAAVSIVLGLPDDVLYVADDLHS